MPKQNSSKKRSHEGPSIEPKKPSFKPKKIGGEIDEIFAAKKRERPEKDKKGDSEKPVKASNVKSRDKMRIAKNGRSKENGTSSRSRKKTADGLTIYTEDELGIGKSEAGGEHNSAPSRAACQNTHAHSSSSRHT